MCHYVVIVLKVLDLEFLSKQTVVCSGGDGSPRGGQKEDRTR